MHRGSGAYRKEKKLQGKAREDVVMGREGVFWEHEVSYAHPEMHRGVSAPPMNVR